MLDNETSNSISQPDSFQLLKQLTVNCWKVKSTHNLKFEEFLDLNITLGSWFFYS